MTKYDEALEKGEVRLPSLMMAVPYPEAFFDFMEESTENDHLNQSKLLNLTLDRAVENVKAYKEFKFKGLVESKDGLRLIEVEYKDVVYPVFLFFDDFSADYLTKRTALMEREAEEVQKATFGLAAETMFTDDLENSYLFQLKLVNSLFDNTLALADLSSNSLFSGKWLEEICRLSAMPSPTYLFTVQSVGYEEGVKWQHTHGLRRCNVFELEIFNVTSETVRECSYLLTNLGLFLLTSDRQFEHQPIHIGNGIVVVLENFKDAMGRHGDILGCNEDDRQGHDEFFMAVYSYFSQDDEINKNFREVPVLMKGKSDPIFYIRNKETARMAKLARAFFEKFLELSNVDGSFPILKAGLVVDDEYQDDDDDEELLREHLWLNFVEYDDDIKTIKGVLQNQPIYIDALNNGDEVVFNFDEITDWIVYVGEEVYTPDNAYLIV